MKNYKKISKKVLSYMLVALMVGVATQSPIWAEEGNDTGNENETLPVATIAENKSYSEINFIDVNITGRTFSTTASVGDAPYYQVFRFTTTEETAGYYTFYTEYIDNNVIDSYGYLCTESQYVNLVHRIEDAQKRVSVNTGIDKDCLIYNDDGGAGYNFYINYELEPSTTYYFVGTRYSERYNGDYKLMFMRDINVTLDNQQADDTGTEMLYSKGNLWCKEENRRDYPSDSIEIPTKAGYLFKGYYTTNDEKGTEVISSSGQISDSLADLDKNTTLYAKWEVDPATHKHTAGSQWLNDEKNHWQVCKSDNEKININPHIEGEWEIIKYTTETTPGLLRKKCTICDYVLDIETIEPYTYESGKNVSWKMGNTTGLEFKINADFSKFLNVKINDSLLDPVNYTAVSGSTIITLTPEYLATLEAGTYKLTAVYTDGQSETEFIIEKVTSTVPQTGDATSLIPYMGLLSLSVFVVMYEKKKRFTTK